MPIYRIDEIEAFIRTALKIPSQAHMPSSVILQTINDGMKEVAVLTSCVEHEDNVQTVAGDRLIPFNGHKVTQVIY